MRLLGICPACGARDTIEGAPSWNNFQCLQCSNTWPDGAKLVQEEKARGNKLAPVHIEITSRRARVLYPLYQDIPAARYIVCVLNTALIVRYGLVVNLATEGGVEGEVDGEWINLRNDPYAIGLRDSAGKSENPSCQVVLQWYGSVLCLLFEEALPVTRNRLERGAILNQTPQTVRGKRKINQLLAAALQKASGDSTFAACVLDEVRHRLKNPIEAPYLAGIRPD